MSGRRRGWDRWLRADRPGIALLVVMLVTMMVAAIAAGAALIGANTYLINEYDQKRSLLETAADGGLELARARLNADPGLYNDTAIVTLELQAAVTDASGAPIPGVKRTVHAIPVGGGAGEHGNYSAVVAIAEDGTGARVVRRLDLLQESFASFSYFTDFEATNIFFGLGEHLYGRVHSNSDIKVHSSGATFHDLTTTAGTFMYSEYGTFHGDTISGVRPIPMPGGGQLTRLQRRATPAHLSFNSPTTGDVMEAGMRIEFVARNLTPENPDAPRTGFIRVYQSGTPWWVTGKRPPSLSMLQTPACGNVSTGTFVFSTDSVTQVNALTTAGRRCYLGGADTLSGGSFNQMDAYGQWLQYPGPVHADVAAQPDAAYLWPLDRALNEGFRGVIFVNGTVVVSGTVRSRVTLAATDNIIIGDDIIYDTSPGAGSCRDVLGLFSGKRVVVSDNLLNSPQRAIATTGFRTYDGSSHETIDGTILALDQFLVENATSTNTAWWSSVAEPCDGADSGRGCLYINGGIIQQSRGSVGRADGYGYRKRYTFDQCAITNPPPYFPGVGQFRATRHYDVDPTDFTIGAYFNALN